MASSQRAAHPEEDAPQGYDLQLSSVPGVGSVLRAAVEAVPLLEQPFAVRLVIELATTLVDCHERLCASREVIQAALTSLHGNAVEKERLRARVREMHDLLRQQTRSPHD